jgi:hypothetical protein
MSIPPETETLEEARARRSQWPVRKGKLSDLEQDEVDVSGYTTFEQRLAMMWQLAQDGWALRGEPIRESSFPRHVGRLVRREG